MTDLLASSYPAPGGGAVLDKIRAGQGDIPLTRLLKDVEEKKEVSEIF